MDRYAVLKQSMTEGEALKLLGFPPGARPSEDEIRKAWKKNLFKYHPDVNKGIDDTYLKQVNVARDILDEIAKGGHPPRSQAPESGPTFHNTWQPPTKREVTFQEAMSKAAIPSGITWMFVTDVQRGSKSWSSDESSRGENAYVAYGLGRETGQAHHTHVFVAVKHFVAEQYYVGATQNDDIWSVKAQTYTPRAEEPKNPAWLYDKVVRAFRSVDFQGRFNSKVFDVPVTWKPSSKMDWTHGSSTSIKHWLVNMGMVDEDDPSVANRKHVVELLYETTGFEKPGFYPEPPARFNYIDGKYTGNYHKLTVIINGKRYELDKDDTTSFQRMRLGHTPLLNVIFGEYAYQGGQKNLTRSKHGKMVLDWMAKLPGLPTEAQKYLAAAAAQMKGPVV